jgi:hypothetical protein
MASFQYPSELLSFQNPSFKPLHHYTRAITSIRRTLTPSRKAWSHTSFRVTAAGLTTTPIPYRDLAFDINLNFTNHTVQAVTSRGETWSTHLRGQPLSQFWSELNAALAEMGIQPNAPKPDYPDAPPAYDTVLIENFWRALSHIDLVLKQFQGELPGETSPVQFWSHNFDLAMSWLSGRRVTGENITNPDREDEKMTFGFSPGDATIPEPYFYVTGYPMPDGFMHSPPPQGAYWQTEGWKGAALPYKTLIADQASDALLLGFFHTLQKRGAEMMK